MPAKTGIPDAYLCDAIRTPVGRYAGILSAIRADDLAALPIKALIERNPHLDGDRIDDVILGCANQAGEDNRNVARMASLIAGLSVDVTGTTINRLCASSLDAIGTAARAIRAGEADLLIAGGVESMSRAPFVMGKAESAFSRNTQFFDTTIGWRFVNEIMRQQYGVDSMPETADNVARDFVISRADQDEFALRSQRRYAVAKSGDFFSREIVPVNVGKGSTAKAVVEDEHPRPNVTLESLGRLKPVNGPDGSVTAGNASGVNDGACALLLASEKGIARHGLTARARVLGMATAGVPPRIMGIGPITAVKKLLQRTGLTLADIDVIELNEAFASQSLAVLRGLGLPDDTTHVNPNGGAIAIGHPLGMSGARLVATALNQLETIGAKRAICTMCVGVGQGVALLVERV